MDKKLLLGLGAVATAGAITGGIILLQNNPFNLEPSPDSSAENQQKIEELYFEGLQNKDRYSFCAGKETIIGVYENSIFGNEKGLVDYTSSDINLFDKEANKLYILGRTINYKYSGKANFENQAGLGQMETTESGKTTEYYKKNESPVRIDYNSQTIFPAPGRKSNDWVNVIIKSIGSVMGYTGESVDEEKGDAKVFCSAISFMGKPLESGMLTTPEFISFQKECPSVSPNPGVTFSGDFTFECSNIDTNKGIELAKNYKEMEIIENTPPDFDPELFSPKEDENPFEGVVAPQNDTQNEEEIRNKLNDLREEMKADARME